MKCKSSILSSRLPGYEFKDPVPASGRKCSVGWCVVLPPFSSEVTRGQSSDARYAFPRIRIEQDVSTEINDNATDDADDDDDDHICSEMWTLIKCSLSHWKKDTKEGKTKSVLKEFKVQQLFKERKLRKLRVFLF